MSDKTNADQKTPDNARITRQNVQKNPNLKSGLISGLPENQVFKRSAKLQRTPPKQVGIQKKEETDSKELQNTGTKQKIINTTKGTITKKPEGKTKETTIGTNKQEQQSKIKVANQQKIQGSPQINTEQQDKTTFQTNLPFVQPSNDSILGQTFEFEKDERYSDIGGFLAEQSLVVGTEKDPQQNLLKFDEPSTSFSTNTSVDEDKALIDYGLQISEEISNIQQIIDNYQTNNGNKNHSGESQAVTNELDNNERNPEQRGASINMALPAEPARPIKLNLKDVVNYVPEYNGKNMTATEYIKKLKQVKSLIDPIDETNLTSLLKVRMTGEAEEALGGSGIKTIDDLITGVRTLYPIDDDIHELFAKMRRIFQGETETVVQYTNRLRKIVFKIKELKKLERPSQADMTRFETELNAEAAKKYKKGLKSEIKYELGQENTVEDISKAAIEIESDIRKRKDINKGIVNNIYEDYERKIETEPQKVLTCQICKDFQHEALFCRSAACVYCKGADHFSNNCMNVKNKIKLICKFCSQPGHSISACRFNKKQNIHCQYCQEMGHDVEQCPYISDYETCWKCKETGHNPIRCTNISINNIEKCEYCDTNGHTIHNCPDAICKKCNKKGHTIKYCKIGEARPYFRVCTICETAGHEEVECEQVKVLVAEYKAKQQFKCQLCEEPGHTAKYCNKSKNKQQTHQNNSNNYNRGFKRKFCEYCKTPGHIVKECRKIAALENRGKPKQAFCEYCDKAGHKVEDCEIIKGLQRQQEEFCTICKNINHTAEKCIRNKNNQENYNTLPGGNA